ncbi:hypothetical protein LTR53_004074 [Teratosphaeriaceae sp. CCFEE 6253]|nr:hypothetical protein LTR53_004074 [Teratosphaeriaceae sp. CCFEE 6253]
MAPDDDIIIRRTNYFQHYHYLLYVLYLSIQYDDGHAHLIYLHLNDYVGYHNGLQYDNCRHNDLISNATQHDHDDIIFTTIQHDYGTPPLSCSLSELPRTSLTIL